MRWREGYVPGGDTRFWVREAGRGDDVALLLHGFPFDGSSWDATAAGLVDAGWRVVAPDVKGIGRSDAPHEGYDPRTLSDELSQLIDNLHLRRVLLVGHDWGGALALATAFRHPGQVSGLVLAAAPYRQLDLRTAWHIAACNVPVLPELAFRLAPRPLAAAALRLPTSSQTHVASELVDTAADVLAADPGAWLGYYRTLSRRAVAAWALRRVRRRVPGLPDPPAPHRLRVPATVVWGDRDPVFTLDLGARVARDLSCTLEVLPGVGHHLPLEAPHELAQAVLRFAADEGLAAGDPVRASGAS